MARSRRYREQREKRESGAFLALPSRLLESQAFKTLSPYGVKLLLDIASGYRGNNNGDLSAPWKTMRNRGWRSEETLQKAKKELIAHGLIAETRKGRRPNVCTLFGLTWFRIDPSNKYDISEGAFPFGAWKAMAPPLEPARRARAALRSAVDTPPEGPLAG